VYEDDGRTYEHRVGGRAGEVLAATRTDAVGVRDLRPGSAPGDVNAGHRALRGLGRHGEFFGTGARPEGLYQEEHAPSSHRALRGLGRHGEFFGTGARPDGAYQEEHAPTSFTPRVGRAGEVLNPTRGFAEDATPRTRGAFETARAEGADEEERGWGLDDALAATDVVVDWAATTLRGMWGRMTGAEAADDGWDASEAKRETARRAERQKRDAEAEVARQREALEAATDAAAQAAAELRQTRYEVSSLFGSESDSDMVLSGEEDEAPPPKKRRSLSPAQPTRTAVEEIPARGGVAPLQPPAPDAAALAPAATEPPTRTAVEALPRPAPPAGLALEDFAASELTAVEMIAALRAAPADALPTPVEPIGHHSVDVAALALADAESAVLKAPARADPARAPRASVAGAPLALGDVDHAASASSDDEAAPRRGSRAGAALALDDLDADEERPPYADDDAAFGSVMDAFAEAATRAAANRRAAAEAEAAQAARAAAAEAQARAARAAADARAAEAAAAKALAAAAEGAARARAEAKARAAEIAAAAARARAAAEAEAARESEAKRAEAERARVEAERHVLAVEAEAAQARRGGAAADARASTALPPSEYATTAPAARRGEAATALGAEDAGAAVGRLVGAAAGAAGGPGGAALGGAVGGVLGQAIGTAVDAATREKPIIVASHRVRRRRGKEIRVSAALQQKRIDELEAKVAEALGLAHTAQKALDEAEARREAAEARADQANQSVEASGARRRRGDSDEDDEEAPTAYETRRRRRRRKQPRCGARNWRRCLDCCLCRDCARVSPSGAFEWVLDDARRHATLRAVRMRAAKLKYLEPPNLCDVPFARRLDRSLQARLALLLWIHGLGCAIQLVVGVGAMTVRLGWTPEFGGALGPPFPLPTLALIKAGTCLATFGVLFRKARIPPCLAALGCAPIPPKPAGRPRSQPFRALTSRLLKQFLAAKLLDGCAGYLLMWGFVAAWRRRRQTRGAVDAFLGLCLAGLTIVDVYGALVALGTSIYYVYYLYRTPGVDYDTEDSGSDSSSDASDGEGHELLRRRHHEARREEALEAFAHATPRERLAAAAVARGGAVSASLAWADPRFALSQTERGPRRHPRQERRVQTSRAEAPAGWAPTVPDPALLRLVARRNAENGLV